MAIYSGSGFISDSADGTFSEVSIGTLKIRISSPSLPPAQGTVDGFSSGGASAPQPFISTIDRFPFSQTSGTATDVGDLSQTKNAAAGHQD